MTMTSDPIDLIRHANPFPRGSLRELSPERTDELLAQLRAGAVPARRVGAMSRRKRHLAIAVALTAAAAAGAYLLASHSGRSPASGGKQGAPVGTPVANASQADALLPFDVVLPSDMKPLTPEEDMEVHKYDDGRQALQANLYNTPNGTYSLQEQQEPTSWTLADLEKLRPPAWSAQSAMVMVDGVHVLVSVDRAGQTTAGWIRGDGPSPVTTWLAGPWDTDPGQSFTKQQALSVAADIISQGG
jgi:hypothetical protein